MITPEERQALLELQAGRCTICGYDTVKLHVDHSYRTGRVRGLLCRQHNTALGMLGDSLKILKAAVAYFQNSPAKRLIVSNH